MSAFAFISPMPGIARRLGTEIGAVGRLGPGTRGVPVVGLGDVGAERLRPLGHRRPGSRWRADRRHGSDRAVRCLP